MRPARRRRAARCGLTLIEVMVFAFILSIVIAGLLAFTAAANRTLDRRQTEAGLADPARVAMDQVLSLLRGANLVQVSRNVGGTTYTTGASTIVLAAPGYNPATARVFLSGVTDYVVVTRNATTQTLTSTVAPGTGSARPARTNFRLTRNVTGLTFTYRVRDRFVSAGSSQYTLSAGSLSAPQAFVSGQPAACTYTSATRVATLTSAPASGAEVQFLYAVSPTADAGAWLQHVTQVDVTLNLSGADARNIVRSVTLSGGARLRNRRL